MKCLTGSQRFFSKFEDFSPKDTDYLEILDTDEFDRKRLIRDSENHEVYQWKRKPKNILIEEVLNHPTSLAVCAFLIPEFANEIGLTIEDLTILKNNIQHIPSKYSYYEVIYDAYIKNNSFTLTEEQLLEAYNVYKNPRPERYEDVEEDPE